MSFSIGTSVPTHGQSAMKKAERDRAGFGWYFTSFVDRRRAFPTRMVERHPFLSILVLLHLLDKSSIKRLDGIFVLVGT